MKRTCYLAAATAVIMPFLAMGNARAQKEVDIYRGGSARQSGITFSSWGSGVASETEDFSFGGNKSIKITTHGRYQGVRLVLTNPVDLKSAIASSDAFLQFVYQVGDRNAAGSVRNNGYGGMLGGPGGMMGGGGKSGGYGGGSGGGGKTGGGKTGGGDGGGPGAGGGGGDVKLAKPKPIANLRVVLVMGDGKRLEFMLATENAHTIREDWKGAAIPVSSIPGIKNSDGRLNEILFFGDNPGIVYMGEVRVVSDQTPLRLEYLTDQTIAKNDILNLSASAESGASAVKFEWVIQGIVSSDAKEASDVTNSYIVVGEGKQFKHQFRKSGDYEVTVTVLDINGIKKPVSTKSKVHVTL